MTIRIGTYTLYENIEMAVNEYYGHGLDQELEKNHRVLLYSKRYGLLAGFEIQPYFGDEIHLHLATKDLELGKKLNFYELHDGNGKPYYLGEIKISEIEKIWEERQKSIYDVPMPDGIKEYKEIKAF